MRPANYWLFAPGLAIAVTVAFVATEGGSSQRMIDALLVTISVLLVWGIAIAVRARYPERPLWLLLFVLAITYSLQALNASPNALLYTLARAARPGVEVLLIWIVVSFPTGRLANWKEKTIVVSGALVVALLWLPGMMFSPQIPLRGPFANCGAECGANLFFVADRPQRAAAFFAAFRVAALTVLAATALYLFARLHQATPSMRRTLGPVLVASILRMLNLLGFMLLLSEWPAWLFSLTFWAVPLGIALGLLRGRLYAARALHNLVTGLRRRPDRNELRDVMAEALDDPSLELGFWDPAQQAWFDAANHPLTLPDADATRSVRIVRDAAELPVAALIHDPALLEDSLLLDAVTSSMQSAIASHGFKAALAGERTQSMVAVEDERRRIERDLHDGSQQRLLALRLKLSVTKRLLDKDAGRAAELLAEMGSDIDDIVANLRTISHGMVPPILAEQGLAAALEELARHAGLPVTTELRDVGRCEPTVESAIYYCCSEALQNAAKHAGASARVHVRLDGDGTALSFGVEDDGAGMAAPDRPAPGQGIANMQERIRTLGGELVLETRPGKGVRIRGTIPRTPLERSGNLVA